MRLAITDSDRLCLDWDERHLRALNVTLGRGGLQVRNAVSVPLPGGDLQRDDAAFGAWLRQTLAEHRIRSRRVILCVPRQEAMLTPLILPRATTDELSAMVNIQIGKELPFNKDQAVIDFAVAGEDEKASNCDIWVAAVRTNIIDRQVEVIKAAGLRLERIGLRPYANMLAVNGDEPATGRVLTVDIGASMTEINVIRDGRLAYSRAASVSIPPEGLTSDGVMDALLVEVGRTVEAYRATDPGSRMAAVVLAGTATIDAAVLAAFEKRFGAPARVFEPPKSLRWRAEPGTSAAPFSADIGLAMSVTAEALTQFDFLSPKEPEAESRERVKRMPLVGVAAALFVAAAGVTAYWPLHSRDRAISDLTKQISSVDSDKKARDQLMAQLGEIRDWQTSNIVWLDITRSLAEQVFSDNRDSYLTKLDFDDKGKLNVEMMVARQSVSRDLVEAAQNLRGPTSRPVFESAKSGEVITFGKDPKYPLKDELFLQVAMPGAKPEKRN